MDGAVPDGEVRARIRVRVRVARVACRVVNVCHAAVARCTTTTGAAGGCGAHGCGSVPCVVGDAHSDLHPPNGAAATAGGGLEVSTERNPCGTKQIQNIISKDARR